MNGRVLNEEVYAHRIQKLFTDLFHSKRLQFILMRMEKSYETDLQINTEKIDYYLCMYAVQLYILTMPYHTVGIYIGLLMI